MYDTHTLAEWAAFLSLGVSVPAALSVPYFLTVDADLADFDPRPALRTAHQAAVHLGHDVNRAIALLLLLATQYRDLARIAVLDARISLAQLIEPSASSALEKGATR